MWGQKRCDYLGDRNYLGNWWISRRRNGHCWINSRNWGPRITKKPQTQYWITQFFKHNKKRVLCNSLLKKFRRFFRNSSWTQIVTFPSEQKGCDYLGKCEYLRCYWLLQGSAPGRPARLGHFRNWNSGPGKLRPVLVRTSAVPWATVRVDTKIES